MNIIEAKEVMLTETHLALSMEYAACGSLTGYVGGRWQDAQRTGLFLGENEARYFFRVRTACLAASCVCVTWSIHQGRPDRLAVQQFVEAVSYCHDHNVAHR